MMMSLASLNQLAELHEEREDWPAAKKHREEVLRIQTKRFGEQDWRTGDAQRALSRWRRCWRRVDRRGAAELKEARRLHDEARRLHGKGQYREAADLCRKALAIRKKVLGPEHPDTAVSLNNLGLLLLARRDYAGARPYYEQALAIRQESPGPRASRHRHEPEQPGGLAFG